MTDYRANDFVAILLLQGRSPMDNLRQPTSFEGKTKACLRVLIDLPQK
jgi:hypothetical protein